MKKTCFCRLPAVLAAGWMFYAAPSVASEDVEWVYDASARPGETVNARKGNPVEICFAAAPVSSSSEETVERRRFSKGFSPVTDIDRRKIGMSFIVR